MGFGDLKSFFVSFFFDAVNRLLVPLFLGDVADAFYWESALAKTFEGELTCFHDFDLIVIFCRLEGQGLALGASEKALPAAAVPGLSHEICRPPASRW